MCVEVIVCNVIIVFEQGRRGTVHCKNIRISTNILWRVFRILTEPVNSVYVRVREWKTNNEARAHIVLCNVGHVREGVTWML